MIAELRSGPVFCPLLGESSDYAQPITGQVTEVTWPVIGWAQPELTPSKRQKSTQISTYKIHPLSHLHGQTMGCLLYCWHFEEIKCIMTGSYHISIFLSGICENIVNFEAPYLFKWFNFNPSIQVIASIIKCEMKLLIHLQTSTVFGNGSVVSFHTLLSLWSLIHVVIYVNPC